jgi:hypothetical protein
MSKVQLVPNVKASKLAGKSVYYTPSTNGKWLRLQVASKGHVIRNGFETAQNMTGFLYVQGEERAKEYVNAAMQDNMQLAGKVIYIDQLTPINQEALGYGAQYPYPFRYGKTELTPQQRVDIQVAAAASGLTMQKADEHGELKTIYRRKIYTDDLNAVSVILTPDNVDEINNFIGAFLAGTTSPLEAKKARLVQIKAEHSTKAKRTAAGVQEEYELLEDEIG